MADAQELLQRIEELEIRYSFQEALLQQLDEVLQTQANHIEELQRQLITLKEHIENTSEEPNKPEEEVPPHY